MENENLKRQLRAANEKISRLEKASTGKVGIERSNVICAGVASKPSLTSAQQRALEKELHCFEELGQFGIKELEQLEDENDLTVLIGELSFDRLAEKVKMECPLITDIIKCLTSTKREV